MAIVHRSGGDEADYLFKVKQSLELDRISINNMLKEFYPRTTHFKLYCKLINECCKHEWINDYIDIDVEKTEKITYCKFCESSRS